MKKKSIIQSTLIFVLLLIISPSFAEIKITEQKLTIDYTYPQTGFGYTVSISGDYAITGASNDDENGEYAGAAYIFKRVGDTWIKQIKLLARDGAAGNEFGQSVSISGDYAIIGANYHDDKGIRSGSAYIFKQEGDTWTEQAKLTEINGATNNHIGSSVSISGEYAVIGATKYIENEPDPYLNYLFKREENTWTEQSMPTSSEVELNYSSVSLSGDYLIVHHSANEHYIFKQDGDTWAEYGKLAPSDGSSGPISISENYAIMGNPGYSGNSVFGLGRVIIFKREGDSWIEQAIRLASDGVQADFFGSPVSISDDYALVGARGDNKPPGYFSRTIMGTPGGSVYIFKREGDNWIEHNKLIADDGTDYTPFGSTISQSGDWAIIGTETHSFGDEPNAAFAVNLTQIGKPESSHPPQGMFSPFTFDPNYYFSTYYEVPWNGYTLDNAYEHYQNIGVYEGRSGSHYFSVTYYLDKYPDLSAAFGNDYRAATIHWDTLGVAEGRQGSAYFNVQDYLEMYPDLYEAFGADYCAAFEHWLNHGIREGRQGVKAE